MFHKITFHLYFQAYVDKAFHREILELDIKCNNHEWGCKWEGEFQNAQVRSTCGFSQGRGDIFPSGEEGPTSNLKVGGGGGGGG